MKTTALLLVLLIVFGAANAQLEKGKWMIGGSAAFTHDNSNTSPDGATTEAKNTSWELLPGAGYFVADRFAVGLRLGFVGFKNETSFRGTGLPIFNETWSETKTSGVGISPFLRYYLLPMDKKVNILADLSYAYLAETEKSTLIVRQGATQPPPQVSESRTSSKLNSSSVSLAAGPAFFISNKVSFELTIGYTRKMDGKHDYTSNSIMLGTGFHVFLGKK